MMKTKKAVPDFINQTSPRSVHWENEKKKRSDRPRSEKNKPEKSTGKRSHGRSCIYGSPVSSHSSINFINYNNLLLFPLLFWRCERHTTQWAVGIFFFSLLLPALKSLSTKIQKEREREREVSSSPTTTCRWWGGSSNTKTDPETWHQSASNEQIMDPSRHPWVESSS